MQTDREEQTSKENDSTRPATQSAENQEQSDPQLTELRGFTDSSEDLEPTLTDGQKAPDKADAENAENNADK